MNAHHLSALMIPFLINGLSALAFFSPSFAVQSTNGIATNIATVHQELRLEYVKGSYQSVKRGLPRRREGGGTR